MKSLSILMAILVAGALSAQESANNLNARIIIFGESIQTRGVQLGPGVEDQADRQTGPGLRLMGRFADDSRWNWELAGRFQSAARMVTNRDIAAVPPANILNATRVKVDYSYWSVGAGYLLPLGNSVDFGMHLEGRAETINPKGSYSTTNGGTGYIDAMAVYFRPWVRVSLDVKLRTGSFYTVVGADAGFAGFKANQRVIPPMSQMDDQTMRSMAPTWSGSLYAGVQF
ncbi:MAG: hypothetical protein WCO20_05670 [Holophagaceae bacterium]